MAAVALLCLALSTGMVYFAGTDEAPAGASEITPGAARSGSHEGSSLDFRLKAVLISPFGESRRATLSIGTSLFTIQQGAEVLPGVRLAEVLPDRVVLARGPRRDVLMLDAQEVAATTPSTPAEASVPTPTPVSAWGTLVSHGSGVLVQSPPTEGIGRELDLAQGDRIVRVNGIAVTQAPDVEAAVNRLARDATIQIDGVRNGKPIRLFYSSRHTAPKNATATPEE